MPRRNQRANIGNVPTIPIDIQRELRKLAQIAYDAQDAAATANAGLATKVSKTPEDLLQVAEFAREQMQAGGQYPLNLTSLIGRSGRNQLAYIPAVPSLPRQGDPLSSPGQAIVYKGQLYVYTSSYGPVGGQVQQPGGGSGTPGSFTPTSAVSVLPADTLSNWTSALHPPGNYPAGTPFLNTTWNVVYVVQGGNWVYGWGVYIAADASRPATGYNGAALGTNDTGLLFLGTTNNTLEYWSGSAWVLTPPALTDAQIWIGDSSGFPAPQTMSGDATLADTGALTLAAVNSSPGTYTLATITVNGKGLVTAASSGSGGFSGTVVLAKLTALGSNGSLTVVNGLITAYSAPS